MIVRYNSDVLNRPTRIIASTTHLAPSRRRYCTTGEFSTAAVVRSARLVLALMCAMLMPLPALAVVYVNPFAIGANNGTSWANAYTNLQTALQSNTAAEIWVVAGVYKPGALASSTFTLQTQTLRGSFIGTESNLLGRTAEYLAAHPTILSGDLGGGIKATHVMTKSVVGTATLEGIVVRDGYSTGANDGAGLLLNDGSVSISYCLFMSNTTGRAGGAIYAAAASDGLSLYRTVFLGNVANGRTVGAVVSGNYEGDGLAGGDICLYSVAFNPSISQCAFIGSRANVVNNGSYYYGGGSIAVRFSGADNNITIASSSFSDCRAPFASGGAIFWKSEVCSGSAKIGRLTVTGSTFTNCMAGWHGGAIIVGDESTASYYTSSFISIEDSVFSFNTVFTNYYGFSIGEGGAIKWGMGNESCSKTIRMKRCRFIGNVAGSNGGALAMPGVLINVAASNVCNIANSIFAGNTVVDPAGYGGAISSRGVGAFYNCTFVDNRATNSSGGAIYTGSATPTTTMDFHGCIFKANVGATKTAYQSDADCTLTMRDCFMDGTNSSYLSSGTLVNPQLANPLLRDITGPEYDLRLSGRSPAIDFHTNYNAYIAGTLDIDGYARPFDYPLRGDNGTGLEYDAGAHEVPSKVEEGVIMMLR